MNPQDLTKDERMVPAPPLAPGNPKPRLPGDPDRRTQLARILRVDQAGEYGAKRIYQGQLALLPPGPMRDMVAEMARQEDKHLQAFNHLLAERRVRPTALSPLWHVAGFALGAITARLGPQAAMACTEAVEEVIDEHYARQIAALAAEDEEVDLQSQLAEYRKDEISHRDLARAAGAQEAPAYGLLTRAVKNGTRLAIWLSERI